MVARCCYGVAMALLGGCSVVSMVLLGGLYGVVSCC